MTTVPIPAKRPTFADLPTPARRLYDEMRKARYGSGYRFDRAHLVRLASRKGGTPDTITALVNGGLVEEGMNASGEPHYKIVPRSGRKGPWAKAQQAIGETYGHDVTEAEASEVLRLATERNARTNDHVIAAYLHDRPPIHVVMRPYGLIAVEVLDDAAKIVPIDSAVRSAAVDGVLERQRALRSRLAACVAMVDALDGT